MREAVKTKRDGKSNDGNTTRGTQEVNPSQHESRPAHDLALGTANELGAGIILMSEPNRNAIQLRKDWLYDTDIDTAIKVKDRNIIIKKARDRPKLYLHRNTCVHNI
ncbi:hypothetical protein NQ315_012822 [Exocentrus adspersus]|uniref:Uncharacterized protein n=1 Tax=Exocentrus adspersus TaxID=1586481 RepID=A0AAV8V8F7_9CUCU|nr:hypothetical protein NQ315_012822 [Exocentrus adspersus]